MAHHLATDVRRLEDVHGLRKHCTTACRGQVSSLFPGGKAMEKSGKITWRQEGDMEDRLLILIPL